MKQSLNTYTVNKTKKKALKRSKKTRMRRNHFSYSQIRLDNKREVNFVNINVT